MANRSRLPAFSSPVPTSLESCWFFSLVLLSVLPVWTVTFFPSQDGPIHLWILQILSSYSSPDAAILRQFFEPNPHVEPNLGFYLIAYPLSLLFGIAAAEKMYLSLLALLLCYGARYAVSTINPHATALSYLSVPMAFGFFTHMGFYNFMLGVALFLPVLTFSIVQFHGHGRGRYLKIAAAGLLLVLAHLVPFAAFLFTFGAYVSTYRLLQMVRTRTFSTSLGRLARETAALGMALLPGVLVVASFATRHGVTENPAAPWLPFKYYLELIGLYFLQSFDGIELVLIAVPYFAVLMVASALILRDLRRHRRLPTRAAALSVALLGLVILCLHAPVTSKEIPLSPRLAPLVVLAFLVVLAAASGRARLTVVTVLSAGVVLVSSGYRYQAYAKFEQELAQVLSLSPHIAAGSTFLPIRLREYEVHTIWKPKRFPADPLLHAGAYIAMERGAVYFRSPLMSPSLFAYFPYVYRREADPIVLLGKEIEEARPRVDFQRFRQATGKSLDYIMVAGTFPGGGADEAVDRLQSELDSHYRWLGTSASGIYQLYESIGRHPVMHSSSK